MTPRTQRRIGIAISLLLLLALGGALAIAVRKGRNAMSYVHPASRQHVSTEAEASAFAEFPHLEKVELRTSDGLVLRGWFSPGTRRSAVVLVHGGAGNRLGLLPEARALDRHGYGFLAYDSRGSGESDGDLITWGDREQRDLAAAVDFLSARSDVDKARIAALGFSVGGSTVALEAARDQRIRAIILYATFTSMRDEMARKAGKYGLLSLAPTLYVLRREGLDINNIRPIDHIQELSPRPLLMVAGGSDNDTPLPVMEQLFAAAREPKEMMIIPDADHGEVFARAPARVEAKLIEFLDRSLFPPSAVAPSLASPADIAHPIH